ncbi:hypothetical protein ACFE04_013375 [Oxalis oulophora]
MQTIPWTTILLASLYFIYIPERRIIPHPEECTSLGQSKWLSHSPIVSQRLIRTEPRVDSFDVEALEVPGAHKTDYATITLEVESSDTIDNVKAKIQVPLLPFDVLLTTYDIALMHFCMPSVFGSLEQFLYTFREAENTSSGYHQLTESETVAASCYTRSQNASMYALIFKTLAAAFTYRVFRYYMISLRSLIDHSIVESFGRGGKSCITSKIYPKVAINKDGHLRKRMLSAEIVSNLQTQVKERDDKKALSITWKTYIV